MDFNTGGGREDDRPLYGSEARGGSAGGSSGGPAGGPPRGPAGMSGGDFNLQDPVGSFVRTVQNVILSPVNFFRSIARRGDFVNPLVFALICALIYALLSGIIAVAISPLFAGPGETGEAVVGGVAGFLFGLILWPIYTAVGLFIGAGIYHLLVMLFVGSQNNSGFEATFRVSAYTSVTLLVSWLAAIPILGILIAIVVGLYYIYLAIVGIREVHDTTTGKAALVVLIPVVIVVLVILLVVLIGAALFFGTQQQF